MNAQTTTVEPTPVSRESCPDVQFRRPNYFRGQLLGPREFAGAQDYVREKLRLHNRCLHGYGVVCGLEVGPCTDEEPCDPATWRDHDDLQALIDRIRKKQASALSEQQRQELERALEAAQRELAAHPGHTPEPRQRPMVQLGCGFALDCRGNELVVSRPMRIDLWDRLSDDDQKRVRDGGRHDIYVSLCYCEQKIEPTRPVIQDNCGWTSECEYGWTAERVRVLVTLDAPKPDERCETCCEPCCTDEGDPCNGQAAHPCCLPLAIVRAVEASPVEPVQIDNSVRRMLSKYVFTTVTGVSWVHNGVYTSEEARKVLGADDDKGGLVVKFSRPVRAATITPGVVEVWVLEGGRGLSGEIHHIHVEYVGLPTSGYVQEIRVRQSDRESLQDSDRVLIIVRGDFILDACCRALDGNHIGGRVPLLPGYDDGKPAVPETECVTRPGRPGPWTSGNGTEGGTFESWFVISNPYPERRKDERQRTT
jgi:hypothetical protein